MTNEEIKAKAEEYATKNADKYFTDNRYYHLKDGYIAGATMMQEHQVREKQLYGEVVEALERLIVLETFDQEKIPIKANYEIALGIALGEAQIALSNLKDGRVDNSPSAPDIK